MGLLTIIRRAFEQILAETGAAEPYQPPRLSDDLLAEPSAEMRTRAEATGAGVANVHRTDLPPEVPHELPPRTPLAPDLPDETDRLH